MAKYLTDTTVLIDHLRGNEKAFSFLRHSLPAVSHVTVAELIQGVKGKRGLLAVEQALEDLELIQISGVISSRTISLMKEFFLSHNLQFLDALIAATAIEENLTLITANVKHFSFIKGLKFVDWKKVGEIL